MKYRVIVTLLALSLAAPAVFAQDGAKEMTDKQKTSYSVGIQMGKVFSEIPDLIDQQALFDGLRDSIENAEPKVELAEMNKLLAGLQADMQAAMQKKMEAQYAGNKETGEKFLAENAKAEGVKVTPSGLQYKVITEGSGRTPKRTDKVSTHYRGTFVDGSEFDSSYKRGQPAEFGVTQVIAGWTEALTMMKEGAKWELFVPYDLAYGEGGRPPAIPPFSVLKFEIELLKIVDQPK